MYFGKRNDEAVILLLLSKNLPGIERNMPDTPIKRTRKRVIRRGDLPASKLATTRKPPKPKPKQNRKPVQRKVPVMSPSAIRADNLNASLNAFDSWRNYQPLAVGIHQEIFLHVAKHCLSCSKRVVRKLLYQHTRHTRYLQAVTSSGFRYNLDGTTAGTITPEEKEHAQRMLKP